LILCDRDLFFVGLWSTTIDVGDIILELNFVEIELMYYIHYVYPLCLPALSFVCVKGMQKRKILLRVMDVYLNVRVKIDFIVTIFF
jgi:hypothetical protein